MAEFCTNCGGEVRSAGNGFKCRNCGATFATLEELKPRIAPAQAHAFSAPKQQPMFAPQSVSVPQSASVPPTVSEMEPEDIYEKNCRGVVEIITEAGRASGFLISKKGLVLTNAHAVLNAAGQPCSNISVKHGDTCIPSRLIALGDTDNANPHNVDLALLVMERVPESAIALTLGDTSKVKIGQHVYYVGNSKGEGLCMTAGIVSDKNRKVGERYFIMTDAATNPGNSGGPLFNQAGEVIGVHVSARMEAVGMKYAIPIDTARSFLNAIEDQLEIPHDTLAENLIPISEEAMKALTGGVILTLVLTGISVLASNIGFIKDIIEAVS